MPSILGGDIDPSSWSIIQVDLSQLNIQFLILCGVAGIDLAVEVMPDWSELPYDLLVLVSRCFNLIEDFLNFGIACKSWHSVATKHNFNSELPRIPWLMLAEEEEGNSFRKIFSLSNGMILNKRIPKASRKRCMESMGWLFTVGEDDGETSLLHPFSGVQIELPHQYTTVDYYDH
ncbi:putative F-box protein-like isoform 2 [Capsicum annuum]|uniref:F-box domain-containing protein n=1 Tax=Capsicum annuum TaxID=4072 RepID=A0A2G2XZ48_CAPAN|nr:putative F-box protein-like isoform 2 [Capsicum annuum]KAF3679606.1 putative F-box protein-like isoform 2 [Capsicum annuum]PHT62752.1 hypothetical protein T459_33415 [Capsicum annuum]